MVSFKILKQIYCSIYFFYLPIYFKTAEDCLLKCIETLQYEPEHQPEGKLLNQAKDELVVLKEFVINLTN